MNKLFLSIVLSLCFAGALSAQISTEKFGKGIKYLGKDSTFYMKMNFRFQNLMTHSWSVEDGSLANHERNMLIRRSRLKFDGWVYSPKVKYKFEMGLSNRDEGGGTTVEFNKAANLILDASITWNFYKNFSIMFGQGKLPGNRERVISSANLQFVDRSRLNSRFNIDRGFGWQLKHHMTIGEQFLIREVIAYSQGEGRNVTIGDFDGANYTFRVEALPFGNFESKGDYVGSAVKYEEKPKLSVGFTYDINNNAARNRGNLGSFLITDEGNYLGKDLTTTFVDLMFKYQRWSVMAEYANRTTENDDPFVFSETDELVGTYYNGSGVSVQAGYMFPTNWELAGRYTSITPLPEVDDAEVRYTFGINKFVVGHKLKVQTDLTYRDRATRTDEFFWRTQLEFQF